MRNMMQKTCSITTTAALVVCLCAPAAVADDQSVVEKDSEGAADAEAALAEGVATSIEVANATADTLSDEDIAEAMSAFDAMQGASASADAELADAECVVQSYSGSNRYETSALTALAGWESASRVIIASGQSWADALAVAGLAGALDCPVLLVYSDELPASIADALVSLGTTSAIVVGGTSAVSDTVVSALDGMGVGLEVRLSGSNRYGTQLAIYEYGADQGLWNTDAGIIVAKGVGGAFADVLVAAPIAFTQRMPIFLMDDECLFTAAQEEALTACGTAGSVGNAVLVGAAAAAGDYYTGYVAGLLRLEKSDMTCIYGADRYQTALDVAQWAVDEGYLSWSDVAVATGESPYDALGGGVLQGKKGSPLLLVSDWRAQTVAQTLRAQTVSSLTFFGGTQAIGQTSRNVLSKAVGVSSSALTYTNYGISLAAAAVSEADASSYYGIDEFLEAMDPARYELGDAEYLQFAKLTGYTGAISESAMEAYIDNMVAYSENATGRTSTLRGAASAILAAAQKYDINEVFLLSLAALESGWGCSDLSQGAVSGYEGYYNFFGIGAYDIDPDNAGAARAKSLGWTSVAAAFDGAAQWISSNYLNGTVSSGAISGAQDTLYKMRYDLHRIEQTGACWHQYATSITWAPSIARVMAGVYTACGYDLTDDVISYDIPAFQ